MVGGYVQIFILRFSERKKKPKNIGKRSKFFSLTVLELWHETWNVTLLAYFRFLGVKSSISFINGLGKNL